MSDATGHVREIDGLPGMTLAIRHRPVEGGGSGDFCAAFPLRNGRRWGLTIGDVCGKGAEADRTSSLVVDTVRTAARLRSDPERIVRIANESLLEANVDEGRRGRFTTLTLAAVEPTDDGALLEVVVAGHPPVLILRADGELERVDSTGMVLGITETPPLTSSSTELRELDVALLYTDGATDVMSPDRETFGLDRLEAVVRGCRGMDVGAVVRSIEQAVSEFQGGTTSDDLALLGIGVLPR